jgi:uncharacterized protein YjbI with pentapeptide repeats
MRGAALREADLLAAKLTDAIYSKEDLAGALHAPAERETR